MFKSFVRTAGLTCLVAVMVLATDAQGAATVSLKAVKKNGVAIAPTNAVSVARNDTITAEVYFFGWGSPRFDDPSNTGLLQTYQGTLLGAAGAISSGANPSDNTQLVLPVGWGAPVVKLRCDAPCTPQYPLCDPFYGCVAAGHAPEKMARVCVGGTLAGLPCSTNAECTGGGTCPPINMLRNDYMFFGLASLPGVDVSSLDIKWAATTNDGLEAQTASRCQGGGSAGFTCVTNVDCPGGTCNANFLSYGGTLNLKVGASACGTYTFTFANNLDLTFINNPDPIPISKLPILEGLTITVTGFPTCPDATGACCNEITGVCTNDVPRGSCTGRYGGNFSTCATMQPVCSIVTTGACCNESTGVCTNGVAGDSCTGRYGGNGSTCLTLNPPCTIESNTITGVSPTHCTVDARRPYPPGTPAAREGFKEMTLTFLNAPGAGEDAAADFQVAQVPPTTPPVPPTITVVTPGPGNTVKLTFNVPIQPNRWTCVRHIASNSRRCIGYLPGDVNISLATAPSDILTIIDNLNGVIAALPLNQCDINRSGACAPDDILTEIDLLNGANAFPVQNAKTIEACPSTTP